MEASSIGNGTILVTGGAGYIGSRFVRDLVHDARFAGRRIRIYDNLHRHHVYGLLDLPSGDHFEFIEGDILDRIMLRKAMQGVDAVVHLAAIVRTPLSFDHPDWTQQVNHWGTAAVVDCAVEAGVAELLFVSSAVVYGPGGPFSEKDECRPVGPYAESKAKAEQEVVQGRGRGLSTCIVRLGTVFGNAPAMRFDAVANRLAYLVGVGRPMTVHGSGKQMRPLIHVNDASAVLRESLAETGRAPHILNAATMNVSILQIAEMLQQLVPGAELWYTDQDVLTQISFEVDPSLLNSLPVETTFDLEQGLVEMLARWEGIRPVARSESLLDRMGE